jgi:ankyrin repeat protein
MDLIGAIRAGLNIRTIKRLIQRGADVEYREDTWGTTALFFAVSNDRLDICRLLLDRGADVNFKSYYAWTPLMYAAFNLNIEILKLLLNYGANVNDKNDVGLTAIHYTLNDEDYNGRYINQILSWRGAKTKFRDIDGLLLFIYHRKIPMDLIREIYTKWIS